MKKITRWTTDCGCSVEYEWDSTHPEATRVHTPVRSHNVCEKHAPGVKDHHGHYAAMQDHCKKQLDDMEAAEKAAKPGKP